jgi:CRISPR/Cas system-associated exonuclease Cas4 (RecB family)
MAYHHRAVVRCLRMVFLERRDRLFRIMCLASENGVSLWLPSLSAAVLYHRESRV